MRCALLVLVFGLMLPANGQLARRIGFRTNAVRVDVLTGSGALWSYTPSPTGRALRVAPPVFEVDGRRVECALASVKEPGPSETLANGATEWRFEGPVAGVSGLTLTAIFRVTQDAPVVRFRYELRSERGQRLTRNRGVDVLEPARIAWGQFNEFREVRLSEFQEFTHSFQLSERVVRPGDFENERRLMGPILVASDEWQTGLIGYEHGSQVPDAFFEFALGADRSVRLVARKGTYLARQSLATPYSTIWMQVAMRLGDLETMAAAYRTFLLRDINPRSESRRPYIFYNTWNYQERHKWWEGGTYLEPMNEQRMLEEIDVAHQLGVDVFVLDTGWYEKTGDWVASPARFPHGLEPVRRRLESYGMKLGLWFDPTAAAVSSQMLARCKDCVREWRGRRGEPSPVWETEASHRMCLVSRWGDAFADKLIEVARQTGVRYFKWDAVDQYGCDAAGHGHGDGSHTNEERAASCAYQLPMAMARIVERLTAAVPDAIVDFDITEGGRAVGLSFLSVGKYFLINNGPYKFNYDLPMDRQKENWNLFFYPGPARTWICRSALDYDRWIPSVLFLTHYFPDDPASSQEVNVASLLLGQNGIWGDLPKISESGRSRMALILSLYKQVREDVTSAAPVRSGGVGGSPEVHEKIDARTGRGMVVVFATARGEYTYVTARTPVRQMWQSGASGAEWDASGRARLTMRFDAPGAKIFFFGTRMVVSE